jgi:tetratricopeptide (TPR) repeat protein
VTPILLAFAAFQAAAPASANPDTIRFQACAALARTAPERAVEAANAWLVEAGRIPARQCLGLAYVALGRWAPAAAIYEQAARDADSTQDPRRTDLWVQAGNSWLAAGESLRAIQAFDAALASPNLSDELRGEVHLDRARTLVSMGNVPGARADLDRGLELVPSDPFAWYLSSALAQRESNLERARTDIARARELAPADPDIMLFAGTIAGLSGNGAEAESLYRQVAATAPDTDAGRAAAAALATATEAPRPQPQAPAPAPAPAPGPNQSR